MKIFEVIGIGFVLISVLFILYINIVATPNCIEKGYAKASAMGCYRVENKVNIYENWIAR